MDHPNEAAEYEPFAIIGMSIKLPQEAVDEPSLWEVLETGKNLMTDWPEDRIALDSFADGCEDGIPNTIKARGAHFVKEDAAVFDAPFFSITAKEAAAMDPQQRWGLEAAYHAFENAGVPSERLRGSRTGVFAAFLSDDYAKMTSRDPDQGPQQAASGMTPCIIPNRVSWYFDLQGPSLTVETACSSGMVALDVACNAMHSGDADQALVMGSSMVLGPEYSMILSSMNFLSPDGLCYSFDSRANGYARGEGIIALVLKPLRLALQNGDVIRAVVRSTGQNQDGRTPVLTQPSAYSQEALIRHVYEKAGLGFEDTRYFEAHGTGTLAGDPIEMTALGRVFGPHRSLEEPLYVGSIKANIGHLEAASGLAGLLKSIMVLEKGIIPPNALFEKMNPEIDADFWKVQVPSKKSLLWPASGLRRVSVNSFGLGGKLRLCSNCLTGANAHAILDDAYHYMHQNGLNGYHHCARVPSLSGTPALNGATHVVQADNSDVMNGPKLLVWSAADAGAVQRMLSAYRDYFNAHITGNDSKLNQLAFTLGTRRSIMPWRTFGIADSETTELSAAKAVRTSSSPTDAIAFVFTGQGAQYAGMGLDLLQYAVFQSSLKRSDDILASLGCEWSLFDALHDAEHINDPRYSQPLTSCLQIALVELLRSFGVTPAVVLGHSSGEIAAAFTGGFLSQESACKVAYWRGQLAGKLRGTSNGAMMSVNLSESQVPPYLAKVELENGGIHTACVNSPANVTLSGPSDTLDMLKEHLTDDQIFAQKVNTGVAYHSPAMKAVVNEYIDRMGSLEPGEANSIVMLSSVTGGLAVPKSLGSPQYWVDNLVSPVRFSDAVKGLADPDLPLPPGAETVTDVVEIGPHPALRRPIKDTISSVSSEPRIRYQYVMERSKPALKTLASMAGALFCHGHRISIAAVNGQAGADLPYLVDCPPYPFDRSRRYWVESRLNRDFRLRAHTPGYLLGRRSHDWNSLHPKWRNWLCVETMPWLADHVISGSIVCPGTGMIVMVLEAVNQLAITDGRPVSGFLLKQGQLLAPITVGETFQDATETNLYLRPLIRAHEKESKWFKARIFSYRDGRWAENFRAEVQVQYQDKQDGEVDGGQETRLYHQRVRQHMEKAVARCANTLDTENFYSFIASRGSYLGGSFQHLEGIRWDGPSSTGTAYINMAKAKRHYRSIDSPVHPCILDATLTHLQTSYLFRGLVEQGPTLVPQQFANLWISAKIWDQDTSNLRVVSEIRKSRTVLASTAIPLDVYALADDGSPLAIAEDLAMAEVSRAQDHQRVNSDGKLLYSIAWKPQLSSLVGHELQKICDDVALPQDKTALAKFLAKLNMAMGEAARKALRTVTHEHLERAPGYFHRYIASLRNQLGTSEGCENGLKTMSDETIEIMLRQCEAEMPGWRLFPMIARSLGPILRNEVNPMELFFSDALGASTFYSELFQVLMDDGRFSHFLDLATHENPGLKMLEVGAGTGGMTRHILSALEGFEAETGHVRFSELVFTDISSGFFEAARDEFSKYQDRMTFKVLNVDHDPASQGFEPNSYDLVIAAMVLHATADLNKTLRHMRNLLRPGGRLVLVEVISPDCTFVNVGCGSLESWWVGEEPWRQLSPLATDERWDGLMREARFSGTDVILKDHDEEAFHYSSIIITTAVEEHSGGAFVTNGAGPTYQPDLYLLFDPTSDTQVALAADLAKQHSAAQLLNLDQVCREDWTLRSKGIVISLLEVEQPRLANLCDTDFSSLKKVVERQNLLWVISATLNGDAVYEAHYAVAFGLLRGIRSEDTTKHVVTLSIEPSESSTRAHFIDMVLRQCFLDQPASADVEYIVHDGHLTIARMTHDIHLDKERESRVHAQLRTEEWQPGPPLVLQVGALGLLDTLRFAEDMVCYTDLGEDEVEIKAEAWPVSFRDVFVALGRLGREEMGFECAGTVTRVGSVASSSVQPGDRVIMGIEGCMRSHPRAPTDAVFKIPDGLSMDEAVAAISPGTTAYHALVNVSRLQPGEKILIHSAAGATGQFAVGVAKMLGAEIFATVGFNDKKQLLIDRFGIPEDHIFYSRNTSFVRGLERVTHGYGVDVVLNSLSGDALRASWECIAPYGRFVEIGKVDIGTNSSLPMGNFAQNASFLAVDMAHLARTNHKLQRQLVFKVLELASSADFTGSPSPLHVYPVSQVEKSFRYLQSGKNTGRIIVHMEDSDLVPVSILPVLVKLMVTRATWKFDASATYLVAGGLGGLGRAIIKWMAERGAKNLVLPSRSGAASPSAIAVIEELRHKGVRVLTPRCDVSSATELSAALSSVMQADFPPIKGCINAAMELQDSMFENMTHEQWSRTIQSKVNTSWNLHETLPNNLDFFILLSSVVGVYGFLGQSNYAAGGSFQDDLARKRTAVGHRASVSLDLGWMRDDGAIHEYSAR
ncbi:Lovastatin diketide synthase LovF [Cytospora mali]|uniref:Lovastatin diketide synthase LovF n=1 Tax=Cytospora mali TaxID=578113 RepID=A0A194VJF4_CYTMA|nr:Lovastatin diketide synthase LovF [Valsa mali]